jgi:predicted small lipoprotein YifL
MGAKRDSFFQERRHGGRRAVSLFAVVVAAFALAGCGKSGHGAETDSDKAADVEILNGALAQELTAIDAYTRALAVLRGRQLATARELRGQDQAHVDALTKAIRGLGGETEAEASVLEGPPPRGGDDALLLLYEEENAALATALDVSPRLSFPAPRGLSTALAASHAQHLVVLRQALGTGLTEAVPEPFEPGDLPPPAPAAGEKDRGGSSPTPGQREGG